jgi:hypothetical protein
MANEKEGESNLDDDNLFSQGVPNKPQSRPPPKQNKKDVGLFEDPDLALGSGGVGQGGLFFEDDGNQ